MLSEISFKSNRGSDSVLGFCQTTDVGGKRHLGTAKSVEAREPVGLARGMRTRFRRSICRNRCLAGRREFTTAMFFGCAEEPTDFPAPARRPLYLKIPSDFKSDRLSSRYFILFISSSVYKCRDATSLHVKILQDYFKTMTVQRLKWMDGQGDWNFRVYNKHHSLCISNVVICCIGDVIHLCFDCKCGLSEH